LTKETAFLAEFSGFDAMTSEYSRIEEMSDLSKAQKALKKDPHALLVFDRGIFRGIVRERDLLRYQLNIKDVKISEIMRSAPSVEAGTNLTDIARLLLENDLRVLPVIKDEIIGIIKDVDLLSLAATTEFGDLPVTDIMTTPVVTVSENETVAKAVYKFREGNISRVPVVNQTEQLVGILTTHDLVHESTSIREMDAPSGSSTDSSDLLQSLTKEKMTKPVVTVSEDAKLRDVIRKMGQHLSSIVVVSETDRVIGIITIKDLIEPLSVQPIETEYIITVYGRGFDEVDRNRMIEDAQDLLEKYPKFLGGGYLHIHVKAHHRQFRERLLYTVRTRLSTHNGFLFTSGSDGWGLDDAFFRALERLERQLLSEKDILEDRDQSELLIKSLSEEDL